MPRKAFTLTPEEAKRKVLEHWQQLDTLARRHFSEDEELAHEALLHVMDKLEADGWRRVCAWQGLEEFSSFLVAVASRLLTDFTRRREGYARFATPPVDSKLQVTTNQLDKLIAEIRALPGKPVGDHLFSDDEFISYAMETLEPQQIERIDAHLASCPECATEMERLVEAAEVWRGEQGEQRLAALWARARGDGYASPSTTEAYSSPQPAGDY